MTGHVLAVRSDSLGDVLVTGPALRALRAGAERLTLLCGPRGRAAAELLPAVDELLCFHAPWIDPEPVAVKRSEIAGLVERVEALRVERAVIFTSFHQSALPMALVLRLAGVPWIGAISIDYPGSLLDLRHRVDDDIHEVERALSLAAAAGFALPEGDDGRLAARVAPPPVDLPRPYVVVHPGASVPARAWSPDRHAELVRALAAQGRAVVVTGAPDERALTAKVAGSAIDLGGRTDLGGLAAVLAGAEAVIVANTGPAHLAAAVGTPVVSLFAPTVPAVRWRPWGVPRVLLYAPVPCADCRARICPVEGHPCLERVTVEDVVAALDELAPRPVEVAA
jgi:ADP-heptose:LPS heptosyltransferase